MGVATCPPPRRWEASQLRRVRARHAQVHTLCLADPVTCCMWSGHLVSSERPNPHPLARTRCLRLRSPQLPDAPDPPSDPALMPAGSGAVP